MPTLQDAAVREQDPADVSPAEAETRTPSRRRFLAYGASAVAAAAGASAIEAQTGLSRGKPVRKPVPAGTRVDPSVNWQDPILRLVRRITMGLEPTEILLARQLGYAGYLEYQLNGIFIEDSATDTAIATRYPLLSQTYAQMRTADGTELYNQLADAALYRAAFSRKQLMERMVEFWTDHFNIRYFDDVQYRKAFDDRTVIRQHALGKFPDMLRASSVSPAMLLYLNQNSSRADGGRTPNQNYAREIMELHTMGADGGYTQNDVAQLSRILTGWTYFDATGLPRFITSWHDRTAKTFLNTNFPAMASSASEAQQRSEGETAITMLINHPSTARYLATKMAAWLLAYSPPQAVVDATAAVYTATGGDIRAMIRTILSAKNLMAAPAKYKRPFHLAASSLRGMGAEAANIRATRQRLDAMDMSPFNWEQPDGYPDRISWWSGLATQRWNWATFISNQNNAATVRVDVATKFRAPVNTVDGVMDQINIRMFGGEMPLSLRTSLRGYLAGGTFNDARVRETLALAASSQEFQWY